MAQPGDDQYLALLLRAAEIAVEQGQRPDSDLLDRVERLTVRTSVGSMRGDLK